MVIYLTFKYHCKAQEKEKVRQRDDEARGRSVTAVHSSSSPQGCFFNNLQILTAVLCTLLLCMIHFVSKSAHK